MGFVLADPNDFVNPKYIVASRNDPITKDARSTIIRNGDSSAKKGPWTITDSQIRSSSNDPHDYLSWAPYHWPNCNWCKSRARSTDEQLADGDSDAGGTNLEDLGPNERLLDDLRDGPLPNDNTFVPLYARYRRGVDWSDLFSTNQDSVLGVDSLDTARNLLDPFSGPVDCPNPEKPVINAHKGFPMELPSPGHTSFLSWSKNTSPPLETTAIPTTISQKSVNAEEVLKALLVPRDTQDVIIDTTTISHTSVAHVVTPISPKPPLPTTESEPMNSNPDGVYSHSEYPIRAHKPSKTASCRPSPTTSMKASETWKTCPYKARDGQVNPDVRKLKNAAEVVDMSQTVLWNSIAFVVSGSELYARNAASFIENFFLNDKTRMNPNALYGQVVRGPPGTQAGTYMGVLDMRGLVKIVNAILVLREANSRYWTPGMDAKMIAWASRYVNWMESSETGKKAAKAANNHGSFYPNQIAALKILTGDTAGAKAILQSYFANQFQEQVVASGEQPLEAVRTRPFHYRCFNIEAIITNAKLGDYVGANFWNYRSKYGATIQTAVDYVMSLDPQGEKIEEALPHVAAIAAVYSDSQGSYAQYLRNGNRNYMKKPFWFYDQPSAISTNSGKSNINAEEDPHPWTTDSNIQASEVDQDHPPALFSNGRLVELEEGLFVSWEDVREFYRKRRIQGERRRTRAKKSVPRQAEPSHPSSVMKGISSSVPM